MGYKLADFHREICYILSNKKYQKILILAPRNHGKTTICSGVYPAWEIGNNPDTTITMISNAASQAEGFLRQVKTVIEKEQNYIDLFGSLKPKIPEKWTNREIIVERSTTKEKDPTISTVGTGGAILSKRAKTIIADDILNKENTHTVDSRVKVEEWWKDIVTPVLDPSEGRLIWVCTAFNLEDLSHTLAKDPTFDIRLRYQAIVREADKKEMWEEYTYLLLNKGKILANEYFDKNKEEMNKGAKVLWPARWPYKRLFDERISLGTRSFNLMYQNLAVSDETAIIKGEWVEKCKDESRALIDHYDPAVSDLGPITIVIGMDLAISEKERADFNVISVVAKTKNNKFVILDREKGHWSPKEQRSRLIGLAKRFNPSLILVENNAYQQAFVKDIQDETTLPVRGFTTTGEKFDPFVGINSMAATLENGQWIIPANPKDPRTVDFYNDCKEEMISFPSGHTGDTLMSLWFAFTALRDLESDSEPISIDVGDVRPSVSPKD